MTDYEKMYKQAFNALTDAQRLMDEASALIREAQRSCEEIFIESNGD